MNMGLTFKNVKDDREWDTLVQSLPEYSFLNSSARYRYDQEIGKKVFRVAVYEEEEFVGIITCSVGKSKIFGNFLECKHSPYLTANREEYWEEVFNYCKRIAKENSCFMLRFAPLYIQNNVLLNFYENNSFKLAPIHNVDALISQHIDLTKEMEELRRNMSKTKRNLLNRLFKNEKVTVKVFDDTSQFDVFKELHNQTVKLKGYTDKATSFLLKELEYQVKHKMCYILIGYYEDKPIGVWQCTVYGKNMHLYQAATDTKFREKNINITYLLFWESVKLGKSLGCTTFDLFGGVVPEGYKDQKHPWSGIGAFKESLGGKKVTYMHSRDYPLSKIKYFLYYFYSWIRTTLKGYTIKW
jgi:lipid II:glycine glycyltransferase (peptidoglycan interpeptide bridge formation enzyme)